jgi:hypothetical protein
MYGPKVTGTINSWLARNSQASIFHPYSEMSSHSSVENASEDASPIDQDELQLVIDVQNIGTGRNLAGK